MLIGLAGGALWALDTVILGMALALPFSYLLLHQVPGTKDILCALLVLLGALLAAYEKPQKLEKSNNQ